MKTSRKNRLWGVAATTLLGLVTVSMMICAPGIAFAGDEILLGTTSALTGKYAKSGRDQVDGIRLWVQDVNARGGLLGKPVRLIHYDDASDKETCVELYEKLITEDKVDLLIGPYSSGLTMEASLVAEKHNFPMLAGGAASAKIWSRGLKNIFGMYPSATTFMDETLEFARSKGLKRVAMIYADTVFPRSVINGAQAKAEKEGLEIVAVEAYPNKSTDFAEIIAKLKAAQPDVISSSRGFASDHTTSPTIPRIRFSGQKTRE